jgi:hypothetical protein
MLHELVPRADVVAFLVNPNNAVAELDTSDVQSAAKRAGKEADCRAAGNAADTRRYAAELVALAPDVILAPGATILGP